MIERPPPTSHLPEVQWYYLQAGVQVGPISEEQLIAEAKLGHIGPDTMVWHAGFDAWKQAVVIPMLAVNLEQTERRDAYLPEPSAASQSQTSSSEAVDASVPFPELQDAVSDEEAEDQFVDANQVRELLVRTSRFPAERSIPPASTASVRTPIPSVPVMFTWPRAAVTVGVSLLGLSVVLLAVHWRTQRSNLQAEEVMRDIHRVASGASRPAAAELGKAARTGEPSVLTATSPRPAATATRGRTKSAETNAIDAASPSLASTAARGLARSGETSTIDMASPVVVIDGPLTAEPFATQLQRALPMFDQQCWDKLHAPFGSPSPNPSVSITMSVDRTGHVYDIVSSKAPAGYRGAGLCIIGRMRGWKFPKTEQNTHATILVARSRH